MENNLSTKVKYIVYLTTNTVNKMIYIGIHATENPFGFDNYLGCGCWANRPSTYKRSRTRFQFAVNQFGPDAFIRKTLYVFDTLKEALKMEALLVNAEFLKRPDVYNMVLGGGSSGSFPQEIHQFDLDGSFIKTWESAELAAYYFNVSAVNIRLAAKLNCTSCGYFWSWIGDKNLDISKYTAYVSHDCVYKFDNTGNIVKIFNTVKAAAEEAKSTSRLILNAIAGRTKSKGFYYSYNEDFTIDENVYNKINNVYLYNLDGSFFMEFGSPKECADYFNDVKTSRIYAAIRTGGLYKGYQISKDKVPFMKSMEKRNTPRKVAQYDLEGNLIKTWDTVEAPFKKYGAGVKKCLKGAQNKTKGFVFKYVE